MKSETVTLRIDAAGRPEVEEDANFSGVPLFEQATGEDAERIDKIGVIRMEPLDEGHVGYIEPNAAEEDIFRRWGGGTYRLQAKTSYGKPVKGGFKTVRIAGDPKFETAISLARWKRLKRQEAADDNEPAEREPRRREPGALELFELQERKEEARRQRDKEEYDRRELEREASHKREIERLRIEAEGRERERRADDERRERERQALEERRDRDRRADEDRRTVEQEQQRTRDREFYANMLAMQKDGAKAGGLGATLELLAAAKELFASSGDGGGDPITALMQNLPAILDKSSGIAASMTEQQQPAAAGQAPGGGPRVQLTGAHAVKLAQVVQHLRGQGIDPDKTLLRTFEALARVKKPQAQTQNEPAQESQTEAQDAGGSPQAEPDAATPPRPARKVVRRPAGRR